MVLTQTVILIMYNSFKTCCFSVLADSTSICSCTCRLRLTIEKMKNGRNAMKIKIKYFILTLYSEWCLFFHREHNDTAFNLFVIVCLFNLLICSFGVTVNKLWPFFPASAKRARKRGSSGGANGEMANLTNGKGKFAIAIFRHFSPLFAIFRHW